MIPNDQELRGTLARIVWFQEQVAGMRQQNMSISNYRAASSGFLAEIERMQLEVREYLSLHPEEIESLATAT